MIITWVSHDLYKRRFQHWKMLDYIYWLVSWSEQSFDFSVVMPAQHNWHTFDWESPISQNGMELFASYLSMKIFPRYLYILSCIVLILSVSATVTIVFKRLLVTGLLWLQYCDLYIHLFYGDCLCISEEKRYLVMAKYYLFPV